MSAVQIVVPSELAPHVAIALEHHLHRCREQGVPVPDGLMDLRDWTQAITRVLGSPQRVPILEGTTPRPDVLALPQVATQLGCSVTKVKKLVANGELPVVRLGGVRRVRQADLKEYVGHLAACEPGYRSSGLVSVKS